MIKIELTEHETTILLEAIAMQAEKAMIDDDGHSAQVLIEVMTKAAEQYKAQTGKTLFAVAYTMAMLEKAEQAEADEVTR